MLEGQVVVVTGGGKGIGRHATKTFAQEKARVVIADFDPDWLESADREIGQVTETLAVKVDVRDEESVKNMVKQAVHHFGQSDVLIITKEAIRTFTRFVAEEPREANVCVVIVSPGVPIATKGAPPKEALSSLARPEILGNGFVFAAQTRMEQTGQRSLRLRAINHKHAV